MKLNQINSQNNKMISSIQGNIKEADSSEGECSERDAKSKR